MSQLKRNPLISFFVLAYALTWAALPWGSFFAPGPLIAALIIVGITEGRAGLRDLGSRVIRWRVGWVWYAAAVAVPLLVHAVTIGANVALGAPSPATDQFLPWYGIAVAIGLRMVDPLNGPVSEEPSFRGFAQVRLQRNRTRLSATAVLAVLIVGWHAPLFFISSFGLRPFEAVTTVAVTFWYSWLFNHADGSVLITLLAHATEGSLRGRDLWPAGADSSRQAWIYLAVWSVVAIGLVLGDRRFWTVRGAPGNLEDTPLTPGVGAS